MTKTEVPQRGKRYTWTQIDDRLGTVPESDLAKELGCTPPAIYSRIRKKGLKTYRARNRSTPAPNSPQQD